MENNTNSEANKLEELVTFQGMMEADIVKSKLDSFEIPCMLKFESAGRLHGITMNGLGKVQIMVPKEFLEQAKEILNTESDGNPDELDDE